MKHTDISQLFFNPAAYTNKTVTVCGWTRASSDVKSMVFLQINDGTTALKNLQLSIDKNVIASADMTSAVKSAMLIGTALIAEGKIIESDRNGIELLVEKIELLGESGGDYPLQKKKTSLDFLRTIPHIRTRSNTFKAVFTVRSRLAYAIHSYLVNRGYKYLHAPIITNSDCEGAGEMFRLTTQPWNARYSDEAAYYADDYFGCKAGLSVSCQLEGEMAAVGGLGRIYTFGPTFRAEHSDTSRHVAEFWHVEPEICFVDINELLDIAEEFIKYIIADVKEHCFDELKFFDNFVEKGLLAKLDNILHSEFVRLDYTKAVEILRGQNERFAYPIQWGDDLQSEHERYLTEEVYRCPVFVVNFPKEIKSFYMKQNPDGKTVAAADLLVPGIGEIIGGSERETDYNKLKAAMEQRNMKLEEYTQYMDLRKYGTVQHSGFGLGFDRFVMYVTGIDNIRDVLQFPRTYKHIY